MNIHFIHRYNLTDNSFQLVLILTVMLVMGGHSHKLYASDSGTDNSGIASWTSPVTDNDPTTSYERHERLQQLLHYVRNETPNLLPGLAPILHNPGGWVQDYFGFGLGFSFFKDPRSDESLEAPLRPAEAMLQTTPELGNALSTDNVPTSWVSPYHDKEFLPAKNAMVMGLNYQETYFQDRIKAEVHPLYGHNWGVNSGYWGAEISINSSQKKEQQPWVKIAVLNSNNPSSLMDNRHGIDVFSAVNFTEQISLNAGVRQNEDTQRNNYVLLKWKLPIN